MLKAKRKRLREEQESMDLLLDPVRTHPPSPTLTLSEGMNCSSQPPHPTKRACVNLCAANVRVLKEEDHVDISTHVPTEEVSKLDSPAVKRPPARYVDFGAAAELMSNASGGFGQDDKEEEIARPDYRDGGHVIKEEAKDGPLNDEEVNGQEEKTDSHLEGRRQNTTNKSLEKRIEELKAFITEDRIKALDELGFDWAKKTKSGKFKSFDERIEELKVFKEKHGHVRFTMEQNKSLLLFCRNMRAARRGTGKMTITEDRIKALDELGFEWEVKNNSFDECIEELKAFKAKHGHVRVTVKHEKSLHRFCKNMRSARRGTGKMIITEDRIKALDELGFEWEAKNKLFDIRVEELKAFKEKHGHVGVTVKHEKSLHGFCATMRAARRRTGGGGGTVITAYRIKALDELGFAWDKNKSFEERIEQLKAFKEKHGHVCVPGKEDQSLATFCATMRYARRNPGTGTVINEDRIKALDELGFEWVHQEIK